MFLQCQMFLFFPSYYRNEGHPWVIVEALASKLPIISTNHAAISESVIDSFNGFLVKKNDPSSIAEKIKIFIDNEKTISKMSVNSTNYIKKSLLKIVWSKILIKFLNQFFYKLSYFFDNIFNFFIIHILF